MKKEWTSPKITVQKFAANDAIASCNYVYTGSTSALYGQYKETNGYRGLQDRGFQVNGVRVPEDEAYRNSDGWTKMEFTRLPHWEENYGDSAADGVNHKWQLVFDGADGNTYYQLWNPGNVENIYEKNMS